MTTWVEALRIVLLESVVHLLDVLDVLGRDPCVPASTRVLGLEPSCTAVFRGDAQELFPDDQDVEKLRQQTVTLAELLRDHTPG